MTDTLDPFDFDDDPLAPTVFPAELLKKMGELHVSQAKLDQFDAQLRTARGCVIFLANAGYELTAQLLGQVKADQLVRMLAVCHGGNLIFAEQRERFDALTEKKDALNMEKEKQREKMAQDEQREGDFEPPREWEPESDDDDE